MKEDDIMKEEDGEKDNKILMSVAARQITKTNTCLAMGFYYLDSRRPTKAKQSKNRSAVKMKPLPRPPPPNEVCLSSLVSRC